MSTDTRQQDLEIVCGNDLVVTPITLYDGSTGTTALNLTGVTEIEYIVKRQMHPDWPEVLSLTKTSTRIAVVGAATLGIISLTFQDTDTLPATGERLGGYYEHEFIVTDSGGLKTTVSSGRLTVLPSGA